MSTATFDKLHEHIWVKVLEHLTPALPKALSGWTKEEAAGNPQEVVDRLPALGDQGATARGDIRVDTLAKLMRTSVAFNQLASRPLYQNVVTDEPRLLTSSFFTPKAHPSVLSKRELLAQTTHLHLEYRRKTGYPSYIQLMGDSAFWRVFDAHSPSAGREIEARIECQDVHQAIRGVQQTIPFPIVSHISIGSVFGGLDRFWQPIANNGMPLGKETEKSILLMVAFIARMPIKFFCSRSAFGPLALPPVIPWRGMPMRLGQSHRQMSGPMFTTIPTFIFHYEMFTPFPSLVLGCPSRFVLETADRAYGRKAVIGSTSDLVLQSIADRQGTRGPGDTSIKLDVYARSQRAGVDNDRREPAPFRGTVIRCGDSEERKAVRQLEEWVYEDLGKGRMEWSAKKGDELRFHALIDAPQCEACCWEVDREGAGDQGQEALSFFEYQR